MNLIKNLENLLKLNVNIFSLIESDYFKEIDNIIKCNIVSLFSYVGFNEPKNFLYKSIGIDSGISIEYTFSYGELYFLYIDGSIDLKLIFDKKPQTIPSFDDYCYINITDNFEFKSLNFQKYFHIADIGFQTDHYSKEKKGFCFCSFRYKMNSKKLITKDIIYVNLQSGISINLKNLGLLDSVFTFDIILEEIFSDILLGLSQDYQTFYDIFPHYPKKIDIVKDPVFLKIIIEKIYAEYCQNIEELKLKILVLKMAKI